MTTTTDALAHEEAARARMNVHAYQLRIVTDTLTTYGSGSAAYARCLARYYAHAIRQLADMHAYECDADDECGTCEAIRIALTVMAADLIASRQLARIANRLKEQL